jgi:hypothetical protein
MDAEKNAGVVGVDLSFHQPSLPVGVQNVDSDEPVLARAGPTTDAGHRDPPFATDGRPAIAGERTTHGTRCRDTVVSDCRPAVVANGGFPMVSSHSCPTPTGCRPTSSRNLDNLVIPDRDGWS